MKIAYLGQHGSHSEEAVFDFFGEAESVSCPSFETVFDAVESGECDSAMIPIENSLAGSVHQNYDLLVRHKLFIVGETVLQIHHCLIGLPGATINELTRVTSHPQALAQCARYLRSLQVQVQPAADTASSVKDLGSHGDRTMAAIGSRRAAEIYKMEVLAEGIEDDPANSTRFLAIARNPVTPSGEAKTTAVFTLINQPGALLKVLGCFAAREIDITKIESRPIQDKLWEYLFYIDFIGAVTDSNVEKALEDLRKVTLTWRVLGSYPRYNGRTDSGDKQSRAAVLPE